ncbi:MAG: GDSL-type esterase/lipase family protein [Pseudomonadota bacterium]
MRRRAALLRAAVLAGGALGAIVLGGCGRERVRGRPVPAGATVLALGDSLTFGTGAAPEAAYPAVLAALTGWNVVNAGVPGHTSAQALERLPALLDEHRPALVLVSIGGNDFLRGLNPSATRANVQRICETARGAGAQVLLIAVPRPSAVAAVGLLSDHPLYGELAEALRLPLHRQGWAEVLADEALRSDRIHANAKGYEAFARGLLATLRASGLLR